MKIISLLLLPLGLAASSFDSLPVFTSGTGVEFTFSGADDAPFDDNGVYVDGISHGFNPWVCQGNCETPFVKIDDPLPPVIVPSQATDDDRNPAPPASWGGVDDQQRPADAPEPLTLLLTGSALCYLARFRRSK